MKQNQVAILSFSDCQSYFKHTNDDLHNLLAQIIPPDLSCFIKVDYPYGDLIVHHGHLPLTKLPFANLDSRTNNKVMTELSYCTIPLGYVAKNVVEVFVEESDHCVPLNLISAGQLFGLFETIDYLQEIQLPSFWTISAGVRNIFTLAKISDRKKLLTLSKALSIQLEDKFNQLPSHWQLFKSIVNATQTPWHCSVIFFGKSFFDYIEKSNQGHILKMYFYRQGWKQMSRFLFDFDIKVIWRNILDKLAAKNYSPNLYISHQVKHLLSLAMERLPGFASVRDDFKGAPVSCIQTVLHDIYETRHWPTIISTVPLDTLTKTGEIFYSLSYPSVLEGLPINRTRYTMSSDLNQIQSLIDVTWKDIQKDIALIKDIRFRFIHPGSSTTNHMLSAETLVSQHPLAFGASHLNMGSINTNSTFWRGCICIQQISLKQ